MGKYCFIGAAHLKYTSLKDVFYLLACQRTSRGSLYTEWGKQNCACPKISIQMGS